MFAKNTMKYPVLVMGLIMFGIFMSQNSTKKWWSKQKSRLIPSTCNSVIDRVKRKAPSSWKMECLSTSFLTLNLSFTKDLKAKENLRIAMYKELANIYVQFANYANIQLSYIENNKTKTYNEIETLEHLRDIQIRLKHTNLEINSQSDGQAVAKFIKLKRSSQIAEHLRLTVKVVEIKK